MRGFIRGKRLGGLILAAALLLEISACASDGESTPAPAMPSAGRETPPPQARPTERPQGQAAATPMSAPSPSPAPTSTPTPTPAIAPSNLPVGFPIARDVRPWKAVERAGGVELVPPDADGPTVWDVARDTQTRAENDMEANRYGWNCRTHAKHEGSPAVDWYLPEGTPVYSTMDGEAELAVITPINSFSYYGVDPRLYLGLPSPKQALYPFPGPSGGMGVFVSILNGNLRAEFGHLNLPMTLKLVPQGAFLAPYSLAYPYEATFNKPLNPGEQTVVARWNVKRGDLTGFVGNNGYSDTAHIHYQVLTKDRKTKYCPTEEPLALSGWLFNPPKSIP